MTPHRGETTAEVVLALPVLVLLVMLCVQVAAWHHAATVATSVAARVASIEARHGAIPGEGEQHGLTLIRELDATLADPVRVERSSTAVRAEVALAVPALIPGLPSQVRRHVLLPRERFVPEGQR